MSSIAKGSISLSKKDLIKSRIPPIASRNIKFYHKATLGDLSINLISLNMPSEMPSQVQATAEEISGVKLVINKKNLTLVSSLNGELIQGLDYYIADSYTIILSGVYANVGAETDEIFVGTINSAPISDLVVASAKSVSRTYELAVGSTVLNLAQEYQVGVFPNENVGIIKVFVNGILALRGIDYTEVDSGNGYGTTIQFAVAPVGFSHQVAVDFGIMSITDNNAIGTLESHAGAIKKIADDLAVVAGTTASDYFAANPSEVERRAFGDMVLDHEVNKADLNGDATQLFNVANAINPTNAVALGQFEVSLTTDGYQKLPGGLILQWGFENVGIDTTVTYSFPIPFPNQAFTIYASSNRNTSSGSGVNTAYASIISGSQFTLTQDFTSTGGSSSIYWFAIGY